MHQDTPQTGDAKPTAQGEVVTRQHLARIAILCVCTATAFAAAGCERSPPGPKPISGETASDGAAAIDNVRANGNAGSQPQGR